MNEIGNITAPCTTGPVEVVPSTHALLSRTDVLRRYGIWCTPYIAINKAPYSKHPACAWYVHSVVGWFTGIWLCCYFSCGAKRHGCQEQNWRRQNHNEPRLMLVCKNVPVFLHSM